MRNAPVVSNASILQSIVRTVLAEQKGVVGACDRAAKLTQAQVQQFKPRTDVVEDLQGLFGEDVSKLKMTSMADSMHALSCHNMTLPCSDKVGRISLLVGRAYRELTLLFGQ